MPIILIWDLTVLPWLTQFGRWFDNMRRSCFLLDRWLEKRLKETEDLERLTSRFPVFRFYNEAVAAEIVSIQLGSLLTAPVMSIGAHLERALGQWDVPRRVKASIRSNQLLPELFRVLEELTAGILASVNRFTGPVKDIKGLFDPTKRTASDLFGLAALTFRAVGSSRDQIFKAAQQVHRAFYPPPKPVDLPGGAGTVPNPPSTLPMEFQLDAILRYVVAGLLVLPALGQLLGVIGNDLLLHLRFFLLGKLEEIERRSHAFRRQILDVFISGLQNYGEKAALFVLAARDVAIGYIQFYAKVGTEYLHGVVGGVTAFAKQLQTFWTGLVDVISKVIGYGNAVISVDIGTILHNGLVTVEDAIETIDTHLYEIGEEPDFYDAPDDPFPVTIGEMVLNEGAGVRANRELSEAIRLLRAAWNGAHPISRAVNAGLVHKLTGTHIPLTISALQVMVNALALPRAGAPTQPTLTFDASTVPDLNAKIIEPLRAGASTAIENAITGVATGIDGIVKVVGTTLENTAIAFDKAAANAAQLGSLRLLRRLSSGTDALLKSLFKDQDKPSTATGLEQAAGAYAQWLIQGGFDTIGGVLSGFVGLVLDEWVVHLESKTDTPVEITKTSPRHLLERARLGRVHTPEVRIIVKGNALGAELAAKVADGFQKAVQKAYTTGQAQLSGALQAAQ